MLNNYKITVSDSVKIIFIQAPETQMHAHKNAQTLRENMVLVSWATCCVSTNNIWIVTVLLLIMTLGK